MKKIENLSQRNLSYNKRKRGLLKKVIELSTFCDMDVFLVIFDRNKKQLVEFNSSSDFSLRTLKKLFVAKNMSKLKYEKYHNEDYELLDQEMSDKRFMSLKPTNRYGDSDASDIDL